MYEETKSENYNLITLFSMENSKTYCTCLNNIKDIFKIIGSSFRIGSQVFILKIRNYRRPRPVVKYQTNIFLFYEFRVIFL